MKLYSEKENCYKLYHGNMLDMAEVIEPNSIDSIVTDPPYELNFMNKGWDNSGIAFQPNTWKKCYDVLKPGGYLLAFGGSRTFHRIAVAIEDAGFEIRDTIMWLYGSGFPKSMNIGKGIEGKLTIGSANVKDIKNLDGEKTKVTCGFNKMGKETGYRDKEYEMFKTEVNYHTDLGKQWSGWGTALKPSYEPIIVARKPFDGSLVDNVLNNGVGGFNIDECRVGTETISTHNAPAGTFTGGEYDRGSDTDSYQTHEGRYPANTVLTYDESNYEEVCGGMPYTKSTGGAMTMPDLRDVGQKSKETIGIDKLSFGQVSNAARKDTDYTAPCDEGSAARYFMNCEFNDKDDDEVLKPFCEPIIVARKPCEGTTTDNVLKYGVGGINIDECRVPLEDGYEFKQTTRHPRTNDVFTDETCGFKAETNTIASANPDGRFPANTILTYDETDEEEVCGGFPFRNNPNGSIKNPNLKNSLGNNGIFHKYSENQPLWQSYEDGGSAARYFYCAKASKKDRDEGLDEFEEVDTTELLNRKANTAGVLWEQGGTNAFSGAGGIKKNTHPTVKPTELMQYLIRLVTPNGGTVLDPFNGSGSTGKAVMYENKERNKNYQYVGIELTEEYLPISKARIEYVIGIQTIPMVTLMGQTVTAMTNKPTPQPKKNILF